MTEIKPQFLDEKTYAAKFDRQFPRDILTEGIVEANDLEITELDTPGMGVKVASGVGYVQGDQSAIQGHYRIFNDASKNLTIAASDPTNDRKDRIIAQVYDSVDIGGAEDKWVLEVLTGTPAPSPDPPALPADALDLAIVLVEDGVTTIVDANITDQRSQITNQNIVIDADMVDTKHASDLVQIAGAQTITGQKTITSPLFTGTLDGWIAAGETWTYASATTITVPSGAVSKYQIGDKIKLTQTTVKYFSIVGVADTLLTITGGDDYTLVDAAITLPYYSKIENPQGFPHWFNWTPAYSALGGMTYTSVSTEFAYFKVIGNACEIVLRAIGTTGGTATNILEATTPIDNIDDISPLGGFTKDTALISACIYVAANKITIRKYDGSNYGLGADRQINVNGFYKI